MLPNFEHELNFILHIGEHEMEKQKETFKLREEAVLK